jgi:1,2-beta-oligoglucan phosphorylase
VEIRNKAGLSFSFLENGNVRSIQAGQIRISMKPAGFYGNSGMNIYLRKRSQPFSFIPLLGPKSKGAYFITESNFITEGNWEGFDYRCVLHLSEEITAWQWQIEIRNTGNSSQEIDLIYAQDVGLKSDTPGLVNEYYVSQYVERLILEDMEFGQVICCRQNMKESGGHPWLMLASANGASSAATDGMQFFGRSFRESGIPEGLLKKVLAGEYAGESSFVVLQEKPFIISAGEVHNSTFLGYFLADHPNATSQEDLKILPQIFNEFKLQELSGNRSEPTQTAINLFNTSELLPAGDLNEDELAQNFGMHRRHEEIRDGRLLSFFYGDHKHVVLRTKELLADRPHAHIMQANSGLTPRENIVSTTAFMFGVFNSHITQGNTNFTTLLSVCTSQFNQDPASGQRIFVEIEGHQYLLGVPSAFEMGLNHCRWIYKFRDYCFQVRTWTSGKSPQVNLDFKVLKGNKVNLIITHDFDTLNGWNVLPGNANDEYTAVPEKDSMITSKFPEARFRIKIQAEESYSTGESGMLFSDGKHRGQKLFVIKANDTNKFTVSFIAEVAEPAQVVNFTDADHQFLADGLEAEQEWGKLSLNLRFDSAQKDVAAFSEIMPWFGLNALIHYLTPYGLEQFSGAAWGTRDVSQGPVDLLLSLGKYKEARKYFVSFSQIKMLMADGPSGGCSTASSTSARTKHTAIFFTGASLRLATISKLPEILIFLTRGCHIITKRNCFRRKFCFR